MTSLEQILFLYYKFKLHEPNTKIVEHCFLERRVEKSDHELDTILT